MDNYPEWTKQQLMLLWFWNKLQDAYRKGVGEFHVLLVRGGSQAGVRVFLPVDETDSMDPNIHSREVNVSEEIPELELGAEAVAVFERLRREQYIHANVGRADSGIFYDLTTKGHVDIGKFPEPGRKLAAAFEAVRRGIEQDTPTTDPQRRAWLPALSQMSTLLNSAPELGQKVSDALERAAGGYIG